MVKDNFCILYSSDKTSDSANLFSRMDLDHDYNFFFLSDIMHARALVRECLAEVDKSARQ